MKNLEEQREAVHEAFEKGLELLDPIKHQGVSVSYTVMDAIRYFKESIENKAVTYEDINVGAGHSKTLDILTENWGPPDYVAQDTAKAYKLLKEFRDGHACYAEVSEEGFDGFDGLMLDVIYCCMSHDWDWSQGQRSVILIVLRGVIDLYHGYLKMEAEQEAKDLAPVPPEE